MRFVLAKTEKMAEWLTTKDSRNAKPLVEKNHAKAIVHL